MDRKLKASQRALVESTERSRTDPRVRRRVPADGGDPLPTCAGSAGPRRNGVGGIDPLDMDASRSERSGCV